VRGLGACAPGVTLPLAGPLPALLRCQRRLERGGKLTDIAPSLRSAPDAQSRAKISAAL